ncbi:hypothetical protein M91_04351, partial [Bos mutus]
QNLTKAWNPMKSIPSLTGETLTALYHHNRDGERKPKRESENSTSLNTSSTGKLVMTSNFANAMPWCTDTTLPTTVISGSAEGPNETGQKSLSRAWCLVLYSLAVALLNYIETYKSLNCSLNVLVWLHPSFLPTG